MDILQKTLTEKRTEYRVKSAQCLTLKAEIAQLEQLVKASKPAATTKPKTTKTARKGGKK